MGNIVDEKESNKETEEKGNIDKAEQGAETVVESIAHIGVAKESIEGGDDDKKHDRPEKGVRGKNILIRGHGVKHVEPGSDAKYDTNRRTPFTGGSETSGDKQGVKFPK